MCFECAATPPAGPSITGDNWAVSLIRVHADLHPMAGVRDRLAAVLGDDTPDHEWADRVHELLYDGESVRETVAVDDARVVVTSHRVLAFTPDGDGPNFRQLERPNVVDVTTGTDGNPALLARGLRWGAIGGLLAVVGSVVDVGAIVGDVDLSGPDAGGVGIGGVLGAVQTMLDLLSQLDVFLQLLGGLGLLASSLVLGAYLLTRDATLVVEVAGEEANLHLPRPADSAAAVARLEAAIFPDGGGPPAGAADPLGEA